MAGGVIIGKVSVKVTPDTEGFRRELLNKLNALEKGLEVKVKVELDEKGLGRQADAAVKKLNAQNREVEFGAKLDADRLKEQARETSRELDKYLRDKDVKLLADLDKESSKRVRDELNDLIDHFDGKEVDLQAAVDSVLARAELMRVARDRIVTLHVNVSKASIAKAEATLAALSGLRLLHSTLDNLWDMFKNMDKNIPIIGTIAEAVMGLSAWLLAAASNTFALAKSLAQIGGIALALPGMLGGFAFGIGAMIAVLKDFKKVLPDIGRAFGQMRVKMSDAFYAGAEAPIRRLVNDLLPQLSRGLVATSALLGQWFGSLADAMRGQFDGALDGMFNNLAASIGIASTANESLVTSLRILGEHGAKYLPRLAQWYARVSDSFAGWLTKNEQNGKLTEWIEVGIQQLGDLGRVARETGGIVKGLMRAADQSGGSSLGMMADTLERVHKVVDSSRFQHGLIEVLTAAHDAMTRIAEQSGPAVKAFFSDFSSILATGFRSAGDAIGSLLDGIFRALNTDGFKAGFLDFLDGLRAGIQSLSGVWEPLGNAIGTIGTLAGEMARNFGPLLAQVLESISRMAQQLGPKIIPVIENLTDMVSGALDGLLPIIEGVVSALGTIAGAIGSSPAGIAALAAAFLGLKVALNSGAIASGLAGLMSFVGRSADVGKMTTAISGLATKLGLVGAIIAGGIALDNMFSGDAGKIAADMDDVTAAIQRLSVSASPENVANLNEMFSGSANKWDWLKAAPDQADAITSLGDALGRLQANVDESWWDHTFGLSGSGNDIFGGTDAWKQAEGAVKSFDEAMANLVSSGTAEQLAAAQQYIRNEAEKTGITYQQAVAQMPQYQQALQTNAALTEAAAQAQAQATANTSAAIDQYVGAITSAQGLSPQLAGEISELGRDFIDFSAGLDEGLPSIDEWITGLEKQVEAMTNWGDNLAKLSERGVSDSVVKMLADMGTEGAGMVKQLVDGSDKELARLEPIVAAKLGGVAETSTGAFQRLSEAGQQAVASLPADVQATLSEAGIVVQNEVGEWGVQAENRLRDAQGGVSAAASSLSDSAATSFAQNRERIGTAGRDAGNAFGEGLGQADVSSAASGISNAIDATMGVALQVQMLAQGAQAGSGLATGLTQNTGAVTSAATTLTTSAGNAARDIAPKMQSSGQQAGSGLAQGIRAGGSAAVAAVRGIVTGVAVMASTLAIQMRVRGSQAGQALAGGIRGAAGQAVAAAAGLARGVNTATATLPVIMLGRGMASGRGFASGIAFSTGAAQSAGAGLASAAASGASFAAPVMFGAGVNAGAGFASGVRSQVGAARAAGAALAAAATAAAKTKLDIHSPSRVFAKLGGYTVMGFTKGVKKKNKTVKKTIYKVFGPGMFTKTKKKNKRVVTRAGVEINKTTAKQYAKVQKTVRKALDFNHRDRLVKIMDKTTKRVVKRTKKMVTQINKAVNRTHDPLGRVNPNKRDLKAGAKRAMNMKAENFAKSKTGAGVTVNFNAPVGTDPTQIAKKIEQRQMDALAMEGLVV